MSPSPRVAPGGSAEDGGQGRPRRPTEAQDWPSVTWQGLQTDSGYPWREGLGSSHTGPAPRRLTRLALWRAQGRSLPVGSLLEDRTGMEGGPAAQGCQHARPSPVSCLTKRGLLGAPSVLLLDGPSQLGLGSLPSNPAGPGPAGGRRSPGGQGTPGTGDCPAKAPQWVCSFACRGHQGKSRHCHCLSGFELKLCFPSVLVSLSRSEPEQGQEQRRASPIQPLCARRPLLEEGLWGGEGRAALRPGPGQGGGGGTAPAAQRPWGLLPCWGPPWAPKRPCAPPGLAALPASRRSQQGVSWGQGAFWSKLPLESRVSDQVPSGDRGQSWVRG